MSKKTLLTSPMLPVLAVLMSGTAWAVAKPKPYVTLTFSSNPVTAGIPVNITVSAQVSSSDSTAVTVGKLQLLECQDSGGSPLPNTDCDAAVPTGTYVVIAQSADPNGTGSFTYSFDTTGLGGKSIGFQGGFAPASSGGGTWAGSQSPSANLVVNVACTGDLELAVTVASISDNPANNNEFIHWSYTVTVTACVDLSAIKVQGGTNGWGELDVTGITPSVGTTSIRYNKRNEVITWTIPSLSQGSTATLIVPGFGVAKADTAMCVLDPTYLTPRYINGAWSAVYTVVTTGVTSKSDYSTPLFVNVLCN